MKQRIVFLIVFVTCGLVHSAPVDTNKSITVSLEATEIDENELESLTSEQDTRDETDDEENGRAVQASINSESEETSLPISCPYDSTNIQYSTSPDNMMNQNLESIPSSWHSKSPRTYYQVDYLKDSDRSGVRVGNYEGILYPFVPPNLFAASPVSTVSYLPPVYSPRIYDPSLSRYISELSNVVKPKHVRSVTTSDEDFMAELDHAAMMNNIIPTMPVQYFRDAGYPVPQVYQEPVTAVFPNVPGGYAIPMLLSCSPKIVRGSFESAYSGKHESVPYNVAYRFHDADQMVK